MDAREKSTYIYLITQAASGGFLNVGPGSVFN